MSEGDLPTLFVNIGWMEEYQGIRAEDPIHGKFAYTQAEGVGWEAWNFAPHNGALYGYVPGHRTIMLERFGATRAAQLVSGVLVVWCATHPTKGGKRVVGWCRNATVYRNPQTAPREAGRRYNDREVPIQIVAPARDARLIPSNQRIFGVPQGIGGFGQANVWYADSELGRQTKRKLQEYMLSAAIALNPGLAAAVDSERARRLQVWSTIRAENAGGEVPSQRLRELGIFRGQAGIYTNRQATVSLTGGESGVTVGLMHTGRVYADELSEEGVIYHYPSTNRSDSHDRQEIAATKWASRLNLPVFVISPAGIHRRVRLGWVEDWSDTERIFYVSFERSDAASETSEGGEAEVALFGNEPDRRRLAKERPGQTKFRFDVLKRYGTACAVCGLTLAAALEAAHIVPKSHRGGDDPGNGLVLCATHHRAYDARAFRISPDTLELDYPLAGEDAMSLRIPFSSIVHLADAPRKDALTWRWKWSVTQKDTEAPQSDAGSRDPASR